jgi:predicted ferric reductase
MPPSRDVSIWVMLAAVIIVPLLLAAASPLLQWRGPVYIAAGFAGILGLALMLMQPLLISGWLPGLSAYRARRIHRWIGGLLVGAIVLHVGGLWIVSPPDVVDVLLFRSPTPFSVWGVTAMWAVFATAVLSLLRRRLRARIWRNGHMALASVIVVGTVVHAVLIEGAMETVSKVALCSLVLLAAVKVIFDAYQRQMRRPPARRQLDNRNQE